MKILLDECVDPRLARDLADHSVSTVPRQGWAGIKNGDLLALAQKEFDALITFACSPSSSLILAFFVKWIDNPREKVRNASDLELLQKTFDRMMWIRSVNFVIILY